MNTEPVMVAAAGVTRTFGRGGTAVHALRGVSFDIPQGQLTALSGRSGSGKTTLLNIIGGLDTPTSGTVRLGGRDLTGMTERDRMLLRRGTVSFIFQSFGLIPMLSAAENVGIPLRIAGAGRRQRDERVALMLAIVGLADHARQRPSELSGGQQQRVAIARALVTGPQVIFADEPTGMLDSASGHEVLSLLRRLADQQQATVVMVTHDPAAAARADRVLFLADGRLAGELADPDPRTVADRLAGLTADAGLRTPDGPRSPDEQPAGGWPAQGRAARGLAGAVR